MISFLYTSKSPKSCLFSIILLIISFLGASLESLNGQPWLYDSTTQSFTDPFTLNILEHKSIFDNYWVDKTPGKGQGWKQYKRWEYFWLERADKNGLLPSKDILYTEWKKFYDKYEKTSDTLFHGEWSPLGPIDLPVYPNGNQSDGMGRVTTITFHPTDAKTLWIGTPAGGLWKTTDGGEYWEPLTDYLPVLGVSGIAVHPNNPDIMYLATGDRAWDTYSIGVLKSIDGGKSWEPTGLTSTIEQNLNIHHMVMHPTNPDLLIVTATNGLFVSTDGAVTWEKKQNGNFHDIDFKPGDPSVCYVTAVKGSSGRIYKSTDSGINWTEKTNNIPKGDYRRNLIAVSPDDPNRVYALFADADNTGYGGLYVSYDEAETWTLQSDSPNILDGSVNGSTQGGQAWYDLALAADPKNADRVFVGGVNVWTSTNKGKNWSISSHWWGAQGTPYAHADCHYLVYSPHDGYLYVGNDGGIYVTKNNGQTWQDLSNGLQITQFYRIGGTNEKKNLLLAGAQDNGTRKYQNMEWYDVAGGDGMECMIDYSQSNIMYASWQNGNLMKSINGGQNFFDIQPQTDGAWITPFVIDPQDPKIIYAGYNVFYKSTNKGISWKSLNDTYTGGKNLEQLAIAPSDPYIMYGAFSGTLIKSNDGGENWKQVSFSLPGNNITRILVHPKDPEIVWLTFSGYDKSIKVYVSYDGAETSDWINISSNLPNVPVNCITFEEENYEGLYVGTDIGVFYKNGTMEEWISFNELLPNTIVRDFELYYPDHTLRIGTFGRGVWESKTYYNFLGLDSKKIQNNLRIIPNPTHDFIQLLSTDKINHSFTHGEIYTVDGRLMNKINTFDKIDVSNLSAGHYIIKIRNNKGQLYSAKFIKQ